MITAVDANVILDIVGADQRFGPGSIAALRRCRSEGRLVVGSVVAAEVASQFPSADAATDAFRRLGIEFVPEALSTSLHAGTSWKAYRSRGGERSRLVPDFMVGAHAQAFADRLLTRDRGFYRIYFKDLSILDPTV